MNINKQMCHINVMSLCNRVCRGTYTYLFACLIVCMCVCLYALLFVCMCVCSFVRMYGVMHVGNKICMHACTNTFWHVYMYAYVCEIRLHACFMSSACIYVCNHTDAGD